MGQLPLPLQARLPYDPQHFIVHEGVRDLWERVQAVLARRSFGAAFIVGQARSGKTHFGVYAHARLSAQNFAVESVDGASFAAYIEAEHHVTANSVVIVDDADLFFSGLKGQDSGPIVKFMETLKSAGGRIAFLSALDISEFAFDKHTRSRLQPWGGNVFGAPAEAELPALLVRMSRQRGRVIADAKAEKIVRTLGRSIPDLDRFLNEEEKDLQKSDPAQLKFA